MKTGPGKVALLALITICPAGTALAMPEAVSQCVRERVDAAADDVTLGQLRRACIDELGLDSGVSELAVKAPPGGVVEIRRAADFDLRDRQFAISPNRANYILYTYNSDPNEDPFIQKSLQGEPEDFLENDELKFQVSFQMPLATELFAGNTDLLFAYTSVAWWQTFNNDIANPFRETNYEPEFIFRTYTNEEILGLNLVSWDFGYNHQSNGQSEPTSRGWDRAVGSAAFEITDNTVLGLRAWHILDTQDNNSDIERYMGYGEFLLGWAPNRNTFTAQYRPASEGDAVQLTWSYPISRYLRLYAQYWNGYGESLIDYQVRTERFGIGVALNDVLSRD